MLKELIELGFNPQDIVVRPIKPLYHPKVSNLVKLIELAKNEGQNIVIQWDTDVDGLFAGYTAYKMLSKILPKERIFNYINETKTHGIKNSLVGFIKEVNAEILIVVDAGTNDVEKIKMLNELGVTVVVIDHHLIKEHYENEKFILINSNELREGQNVSGTYMVNEVMKQVVRLINADTITDYDELAVISIVSDVCERDNFNRNILLNYILGSVPMSPFIKEVKRSRPKCTIKFAISLSSNLNALIRLKGPREVMDLMLNKTHELSSLMYNIGRVKSDNEIIVNELLKNSQVFEMNNIIMIIIQNHHNNSVYARNYLGIIANKIAKAKNKLCLVMCDKNVNFEEPEDDYIYVYSARDYVDRDSISKMIEVGIDANGHSNAFGGKLQLDFVSKLQTLDRMLNENSDIKLRKPRTIKSKNIIETLSALSETIANIAIWNTLQSEENKIGIEFKLQGMISQQGKIKKIQYKGFTFNSFESSLTEGDNVICIPEMNSSIDLMIIK